MLIWAGNVRLNFPSGVSLSTWCASSHGHGDLPCKRKAFLGKKPLKPIWGYFAFSFSLQYRAKHISKYLLAVPNFNTSMPCGSCLSVSVVCKGKQAYIFIGSLIPFFVWYSFLLFFFPLGSEITWFGHPHILQFLINTCFWRCLTWKRLFQLHFPTPFFLTSLPNFF